MMGSDELVALLDQVKNRLCHGVFTIQTLGFQTLQDSSLSLCLGGSDVYKNTSKGLQELGVDL